ncbi:MAG TPA: hypothetical protein VFC56_07105 [Stellaceae bacterium]|nr:hypothetical protein [Stellaceae bacterium]
MDFTAGIEDAGDASAPAVEPPEPTPAAGPVFEIVAEPPARAAPARRTASPDLGKALRRFAPPTEPPPVAKSDPIPGLSARFARVPVAREPQIGESSRSSPPPWIARLADPPKSEIGVGVEPDPPSPVSVEKPAPIVADPPRQPSPAAEPPAPLPWRVVPGARDEAPFPASFYTPASIATGPAEPSVPLAAMPSARFRRIGEATRLRFRLDAGRLAESFARATAAVRRGIPARRAAAAGAPPAAAEPGPARSPPGRAFAVAVMRLSETVNRWGRRATGGDSGLRLSALITLGVMLVAAIAYGGGALIAARSGAEPKRQIIAEQPLHPVQAVVLVAPPPALPAVDAPQSAAAVRAASYLARAKAGDATAQYDSGVLYATGDGLMQDYASAVSWFRAAAAQGNIDAEYNLGVLYERGLGVAADPTEALNWYRSAADQNHAGAQFNLAVAYADGRGAAQDFTAASRWYLRAARQGLVPAMVNLAILYERGDGVARSLIDAYAWYSAAANRGAADAKDRAGQLFQQFSDADKARAEALAAMLGAPLASAKPPA